jgi:hypothetical protein
MWFSRVIQEAPSGLFPNLYERNSGESCRDYRTVTNLSILLPWVRLYRVFSSCVQRTKTFGIEFSTGNGVEWSMSSIDSPRKPTKHRKVTSKLDANV